MSTQTLVLLGVLAAAAGGFLLIQSQAASTERLEKLQASWTATQTPAQADDTWSKVGSLFDSIF